MQELSVDQTRALVESVTKTFGQSGAAKHLNKNGFMSREGKEIRQAHIARILSGSPTQFLAPEPEVKEPSLQPPPSPALTPRPTYQEQSPSLPLLVVKDDVATPFSDEELTREEALRELHTKNRAALREELETEEELRKLKESELPALVPAPRDHSRAEHPHVQQMAKVTGIFTRRGPAPELEEEKTYYGIPAMQRKSSTTITRPHEVTHFGSNVMSTRDLCVKRKKDA